ncbi:hypothetical protein GQ457_15G023500 [Hibiscus cannabinus]
MINYRGILQTYEGFIRAMFSGPLPELGAEYAGITTIKLAMEVFEEAGWAGVAELVVELDSKVVLNLTSNLWQRPWIWWGILIKRLGESIRSLIAMFLVRAMLYCTLFFHLSLRRYLVRHVTQE